MRIGVITYGFILITCISGCIGTDFLDEAVNLVDPVVVVAPEVESIEVGQAVSFEAVYYDSTGAAIESIFEWQSTDPGIAGVTEDGVAMGRTSGQVRIRAKARGLTGEALLTVVSDPDQVASVVVSPAAVVITVGEEVAFSAAVTNGRGEEIVDPAVAWKTDIDTLATVDAEGTVQALKPGQVQVTATVDGIESAPARLEILPRSRSGTFMRTPGTSYSIAGTATLERVEGAGLQLRFLDDFSVSNGPDLFVYLSTESKVNATSLSLGRLFSISGEQVYPLPNDVGINDFDNVLIHCLPFNVTFGFAPLN